VGDSYEAVKGLHAFVAMRRPQALLYHTADYWRLWARKEQRDLDLLPAPVVELHERSLFVWRTQIDSRGW